jgi:hypothetical protein
MHLPGPNRREAVKELMRLCDTKSEWKIAVQAGYWQRD